MGLAESGEPVERSRGPSALTWPPFQLTTFPVDQVGVAEGQVVTWLCSTYWVSQDCWMLAAWCWWVQPTDCWCAGGCAISAMLVVVGVLC